MARCPKCGSSEVRMISDEDIEFIRCLKCGFNELEESIISDTRSGQREKRKYNPYKVGGKRRSE